MDSTANNVNSSSIINSVPRKKFNGSLVLIIILIMLLFTSLVSNYYFLKNKPPVQTQDKVSDVKTSPNQNTGFPIDPKNEHIAALGYFYFFKGTIKDITNTTSGLELKTDITGNGIPKFVITPQTFVFENRNGIYTQVKADGVKVGQKVNLSGIFDYPTGVWQTFRINLILSEKTATPTPAKR